MARHQMTARRRAALRKAQLASARKRKGRGKNRNSIGVRVANRRAATKKVRRVGTLVTPTVNHKTGRTGTKAHAVFDSKHNARRRVRSTLVGAAVGTAIAPGLGTYVGGVYGAHRGRQKYGQTIKPIHAVHGKKTKSHVKKPKGRSRSRTY